jgi:argininosuccinate lyase
MSMLWQKSRTETDEDILAFTVGDDAVLDNRLIPYDVIGSVAHARGLEKIGLLTAEESAAVVAVLNEIRAQWEEGAYLLQTGDEDVHSALERTLVEKLGTVGKKIHTGRSRNDQVLTALRLFMKDVLRDMMETLAAIVKRASDEGGRRRDTVMPGYTHMQPAMPTTVAFWYESFGDSWADALEAGAALLNRIDQSPLGAGAGFGVPLPLDREYTAALMGFGRVQVNAAAVQNSRGRLEAALINWLVDVGRDVEKMAWDLLLFSTREFGFVKIPDSFCTGSSIMPQKKNPDVLELLRATPSVLLAARNEVEAVIAKLPSSYHRDYQLTKAPFMRAMDSGRSMLSMVYKLLGSLEWNVERMAAACTPEIFATHRALHLVQEGVAFRDAYRQAAEELENGRVTKREKLT